MKPSVPKVVITTDKPKPPVIVSKSKEGIATKQEQVSITHEKVNSTIASILVFYPPSLETLCVPQKILTIHFQLIFSKIYFTHKLLEILLIRLYYSTSDLFLLTVFINRMPIILF